MMWLGLLLVFWFCISYSSLSPPTVVLPDCSTQTLQGIWEYPPSWRNFTDEKVAVFRSIRFSPEPERWGAPKENDCPTSPQTLDQRYFIQTLFLHIFLFLNYQANMGKSVGNSSENKSLLIVCVNRMKIVSF
jgi:hypothetical protein